LSRRTWSLAFAIALLAAAPAHADITVSNVHAASASPQAGAHSNFTLSFQLGGSESIRDLDVNLPPGLLGNPNAVARCTQEQFASDSCPPESQVGSEVVNVTVMGLPPTDLLGAVFNLVPDKPEPAQFGIRLDTPTGSQRLKSDVTVRPSDSGLTSTIRGIPNTFGPASVHVNKISLTLNAYGPSGKGFMTNPTSCDPATTTLRIVGHGDSEATGQNGFTPTACGALPYAPKLTATIGSPGRTGANSVPPLTTIITQKEGEAATKSSAVTLSSPLSPNVSAIANVCSTADYSADTCPAKSRVGSAQVISPVLATPLSGPVRLVENPNGLPKVVVYLNGVINTRLQGEVTLTTQGSTTTFASIPDVPLSRFRLDFIGGPNGLVDTLADLCKTPASLAAEFKSHSGKTVTLASKAAVKGCPPTSSLSLERLAKAAPLLVAKVNRGASGTRLRSATISLPGPLSFDRGYLSPGVKVASGVEKSFQGNKTLRLRAKSADGVAQLGARVTRGALLVGAGLRKQLSKHPKLLLVVRVTDVDGKTFTLRNRVAAR
jgi:hypothetical protein